MADTRSPARYPRIPSIAKGRKGRTSVCDALVVALWAGEEYTGWPHLTLDQLQASVTRVLGYSVSGSTVRSALYSKPEVFEKAPPVNGRVSYRLSRRLRKKL